MKYKNEKHCIVNGIKVTTRVLDVSEEERREYANEIVKEIIELKRRKENS